MGTVVMCRVPCDDEALGAGTKCLATQEHHESLGAGDVEQRNSIARWVLAVEE